MVFKAILLSIATILITLITFIGIISGILYYDSVKLKREEEIGVAKTLSKCHAGNHFIVVDGKVILK